jgi:hypothetical protein
MQGSPYVFALSQGILASVVAIVVQGFTTGLAHREFVYVFVTLGICLQALAEAEAGRERPEQAPLEQTSLEHAV